MTGIVAARDIDIYALPIPDFGLHCPDCDYALVGLPQHRCPECGLSFDMADLVRPYTVLRPPETTGDELPMPDFGLRCPDCAEPLAGAERHECPACGRRFSMDEFRSGRDWVIVFNSADAVQLSFARLVLRDNLVPTLATEDEFRKAIGAVGLKGLGPRIEVPRAFFFEAKLILRRGGTHRGRPGRRHRRAGTRLPPLRRAEPAHIRAMLELRRADVGWASPTTRDYDSAAVGGAHLTKEQDSCGLRK